MNISISPALKRFAEKQARSRGLRGASEYISELLRFEQQRRAPLDARLQARLREGAKKWSKRDLAIAEDWFPLEEEVNGQGKED
jgi:Arc/MetJ-type ribon-helix-helix transcriptional regulator